MSPCCKDHHRRLPTTVKGSREFGVVVLQVLTDYALLLHLSAQESATPLPLSDAAQVTGLHGESVKTGARSRAAAIIELSLQWMRNNF